MAKNFYITTTLPYVNADLHMGHALEFVRADVVARYHAKKGDDVFFNTGTDEHGMKIFDKAKSLGKTPQEFTDEGFEHFKNSVKIFGLSENIHYIRTTDKHHEEAAQEFWRRVFKNGHIYKKNYEAKYCVGCESEKTDSELVDGHCPDHPTQPITTISEENYFFRMSAFQKKLLDFYATNSSFVVPDFRFNEVRAFVMRGLEDFSISRLKEKMPWGIPVPGDDAHVMYVWFDALTNYISTLGWPKDESGDFKKYWESGTPTQYCGKDNTRFQAIVWQAMLMAVEVPNSHKVVVDGFILGEGNVKMSKSIGNVIDPKDIVSEYGTDALRLFLLKEVSNFEDAVFTKERFKETYNTNFANGIGNLLSRTLTMTDAFGGEINQHEPVILSYEVHGFSVVEKVEDFSVERYVNETTIPKYETCFENFEIATALAGVWELIGLLDRLIARTEPFKLVKNPDTKLQAEAILYDIISGLVVIADLLDPVLPETAKIMHEHLGTYDSMRPAKFVVKKMSAPLFPRK
ncbi:MAG: methionine--tRNA ligase [bacterium]